MTDNAYGGYRGMWRDAEDELVKMRAEVERLREALREALGSFDSIIRADATVYEYKGKRSLKATDGSPPRSGTRWSTPAEIARDAYARIRDVAPGPDVAALSPREEP